MNIGPSISQMRSKVNIDLEKESKELQIFWDVYEEILNKDYIFDSPEVDAITHAVEWSIDELLYEKKWY